MGSMQNTERTRTRFRMVQLAIGVVLVGALGFTEACSGSQAGTTGAGADTTREAAATASALEQIERQRLAALVDADMEVVERLHAEDFELVPPPGVALTRDEYVTLVSTGDLDYQAFDPISDIEVHVHGTAATLWYQSKIDVVAAGQGHFVHEAWHLSLFEKRGGQWQVVREQATAVGGFPPAESG
jgi:ketosteroid isomerase-like protein